MRAHRIRAGLFVLGALVVAGPLVAIGCAQAALEADLTPIDSGTDAVVKPIADAAKDHGYGNAGDSAGPVVDTGVTGDDDAATGDDDATADTSVPHDAAPDVTLPTVDAGTDSGPDAVADVAVDAPSDAIADAIADVAIDTGCPVACGAQMACVVGVCSPARRVFVSSKGSTGNLGGALGADATCQSLATAASLGGTWMAWISDNTTSPSARFTKSTDPYRLIDGTLIALNWASLVSPPIVNSVATLPHAIDHDEYLNVVSNSEVWTSTGGSGSLDSAGCSGFTSGLKTATYAYVGGSGKTDHTWTEMYQQYCDRTDPRLYCFEQ